VTTEPTPTAAPKDTDQDRPSTGTTGPRAHIGWIVAGSMAAGFVAALLLVAMPFIPASESAVTGAALCGFAVGWALLAWSSTRFTDQPQRWAVVPALVMGLPGVLLFVFGAAAYRVLDWLWPPVVLALAIWMIARVRRQLSSRGARWMLYPLIAFLGLAAIGGGYETVREAADARAYPLPGRLIDVGGHRLHLNCSGTGSPTVVLEPGAGGMSSNLGWITPAVARDTRVCVYDRAGRGWSEPSGAVQDGVQVATDLHTLLQRGQVPGPYVLAGHSFGGLYVLTFAARYPDEVAGLVLVDSTAPNVAGPPPGGRTSYDGVGRISALVSISARLGVGRLFANLSAAGLPPRPRDEVSAKMATASSVRSTIEEYLRPSAARQAAALTDFADKPLVVLTAGSGHDASWMAAQDKLATLSTNSVHRVVPGATHPDLVSEEKPAAATTRAVLDVVSSVRTHQPLPPS
jgi:pimeloyl-ACP methyl ester carboxylesterase